MVRGRREGREALSGRRRARRDEDARRRRELRRAARRIAAAACLRHRLSPRARHRRGGRDARVWQHHRQPLGQRRPRRSLAASQRVAAADLLRTFHGLNGGAEMSVTESLAAYVVDSTLDAIPRDVQREATRALVNYLGCALGGSIEPALDVATRTLEPVPVARARCVGRRWTRPGASGPPACSVAPNVSTRSTPRS